MRKKCRIKIRKGLSPFEGGYFEERFGRGDGLKAFSLDDLWGEKGEEVRGRFRRSGRGKGRQPSEEVVHGLFTGEGIFV